MNCEWLSRFVLIAERGNLGSVAHDIGVSQPVLSRQIARLENEYGTRLFNRTSSGMTLSPSGAALYGPAKEIVRLMESASRAVNDASAGATTIHVGYRVLSRAARARLDNAIAALAVNHPEINVEYSIFDYSDPTCGLAQGTVDVAIVQLPLALDVDVLVIEDDPIYMAVGPAHPLVGHESADPSAFAHDRLIVGTSGDEAWNAFIRDVRGRISHRGTMTITSGHQWLHAVADGLAVGLTTKSVTEMSAFSSINFVRVEGVPVSQLAFAWRANSVSPLAALFVEQLRENDAATIN